MAKQSSQTFISKTGIMDQHSTSNIQTNKKSQTVISRFLTIHKLSTGSAIALSQSGHLFNQMIKRDPLLGRDTLNF
jgi:hypothetical protein